MITVTISESAANEILEALITLMIEHDEESQNAEMIGDKVYHERRGEITRAAYREFGAQVSRALHPLR